MGKHGSDYFDAPCPLSCPERFPLPFQQCRNVVLANHIFHHSQIPPFRQTVVTIRPHVEMFFHKQSSSFPHFHRVFPHSLRMWKTYQHHRYPQKVFHIFRPFSSKCTLATVENHVESVENLHRYTCRLFTEKHFSTRPFQPLMWKRTSLQQSFLAKEFPVFP